MYRKDIDILKGFAILAVIFYHFGFATFGYLGVDLFFVINGFLITLGLIHKTNNSQFSYWEFITKRFSRLFPLVIISSLTSLIIGAVSMLPDNFENISISVIASNVFSHNILSAKTVQNYWNVANNYKPLMHTWYLGIIAEFYIIYPLIFILCSKLCKKQSKQRIINITFITIILCTIISFALYILPVTSNSKKFYYLPFRFFELSAGGIIAFIYTKAKNVSFGKSAFGISSVLLLCLMFIDIDFMPAQLRLIITVVLSCIAVCFGTSVSPGTKISIPIVSLGQKSYSYFIWHQPVLAFWRSYVSGTFDITSTIVCLIIIVVISELSYHFIEKKIKASKNTLIICICSALVLCLISGVIYLRAGVIRDVPELDVYTNNIQRNMHAKYCDRIYGYDKEFPQNDKKNIFVIGNSFSRDWSNILLESEYADEINISYTYSYKEEHISRVEQSDYIFIFCESKELYERLCKLTDKNKIWGIGTKKFGECNDMIYLKRFSSNYFETTVDLPKDILDIHNDCKQFWGEHYIDMIAPVTTDDGKIRIFTDDNKFISQDCLHLTQNGAKFYVNSLKLDRIFGTK